MSTGTTIAQQSGSAISRLGGAFMLDPAMVARGSELGYVGWPYYYGGRAGVLGEVDADVVAAATFFIPVEIVRKGWTKALAVGPLDVVVKDYRDACADWGRAHLSDVAGLERLLELSERVAAEASPLNAPLFAGWRALEWPADAAGRLALALHALREHRGAMHAVAVQASGLSALEATATSKLAQASLQLFSWPQPWPEVTDELRERRARADALTDELAGSSYCLSAEEGAEWAGLLNAAKAHVFPRKS